MAKVKRFELQSPMDYLITTQGSIDGLFDFLVSNNINYNKHDFYSRKEWNIEITRRINTSTIATSLDYEKGGASFNKSFNKSFDILND